MMIIWKHYMILSNYYDNVNHNFYRIFNVIVMHPYGNVHHNINVKTTISSNNLKPNLKENEFMTNLVDNHNKRISNGQSIVPSLCGNCHDSFNPLLLLFLTIVDMLMPYSALLLLLTLKNPLQILIFTTLAYSLLMNSRWISHLISLDHCRRFWFLGY